MDLRPTTRELNFGIARNYLLPRFGGFPLAEIRPTDVRAMVAEELAAAKLSGSAVRRHAIVLGTILEAAVQDGRIARNPVRGVKLPPERARRMRFLEASEVAMLVAAHPEPYRPMVLSAAYVGLRWGGLVGLAWTTWTSCDEPSASIASCLSSAATSSSGRRRHAPAFAQ